MRTEDDLHFYQLNMNRFCGLILLNLRVDRFYLIRFLSFPCDGLKIKNRICVLKDFVQADFQNN